MAELNSTDEREILQHLESDENPSAADEAFENTWPSEKDLLGAFEGVFEAKGHRVDLQGIRVLKKSVQDGVPGSCFGDCEDNDDEVEWVRKETFVVVTLLPVIVSGIDWVFFICITWLYFP